MMEKATGMKSFILVEKATVMCNVDCCAGVKVPALSVSAADRIGLDHCNVGSGYAVVSLLLDILMSVVLRLLPDYTLIDKAWQWSPQASIADARRE